MYKSAMLIDYLQAVPPRMRPLAPHMWLLLVQVDVGVGSGMVVLGVLTVSIDSEDAGLVLGAGGVSASGVGLASSWWDLSDRDSVGMTEGEDASSRVSSVGAMTLVEVTVGAGGRVLPEASTVRMVVLLMVGPGGVIVTMCVVGVWVLDSVVDELVDAVPTLLMISASIDTPAPIDWVVELLEDEIEVVNVVLAVVLRVVVSTTEA